MAQLKSSTQERLDGKVSLTEKGAANGVATLDGSSKLIQMPTLSDVGAEAANPNIQTHIASTSNPHGVTLSDVGAEAANPNIQTHIASTSNPHGVTSLQVGAIPVTEKGVANGVADLDANGEVIKPQAGAGAQTAAGLGAGYRRADGTWAKKATYLGPGFPLQTWADNLVAGVVYDVYLPVAQNGLPTGWWYIEVLRHSNDISSNQFRVIRATSFGSGNSANLVYQSTNTSGTWTPFYQFALNTPLNWVTPTFVNGWANYPNISWMAKDSLGNVYLQVGAKGGSNTTDTILFTLPIGMRPTGSEVDIAAVTYGGAGCVYIRPNGDVHFYGANPHTGNASVWVVFSAVFKAVG